MVSCTNIENKSINELKIEYPLVKFYINDSFCKDNIPYDSNKYVNDLKIDTTNSKLLVSFDCSNVFGKVEIASIERVYVKKVEFTFCDTIFLNYSFVSNPQITKPLQKRLYYEITDRLSYQKCKFIPRDLCE